MSRHPRAQQLRDSGLSDTAVYEAIAREAVEWRLRTQTNRCPRCWHDKETRCICHRLASNLQTQLPVKSLVLMHHSEYLRASDDAKLLLAMLPPDRAELFIFPNDLPKLQVRPDLTTIPVPYSKPPACLCAGRARD
jgi:DTW domain-containing protein YfiP